MFYYDCVDTFRSNFSKLFSISKKTIIHKNAPKKSKD